MDFSFQVLLLVSLNVPLTDMQDSAAAKAICPEGSLVAFYKSLLFLIDLLASPLGIWRHCKKI